MLSILLYVLFQKCKSLIEKLAERAFLDIFFLFSDLETQTKCSSDMDKNPYHAVRFSWQEASQN